MENCGIIRNKKLNIIQKILFCAFIFFISISTIFAQEEGSKAPDFELKSLSGDNFKLSNLQGKIIIIDFWASWCVPCRLGIPFLSELYDIYKDKGVEIIGINLDNKLEKIEKFLSKLSKRPSFNILWDSSNTTPTLYKVTTMPTTIFINKEGIIAHRHLGFKIDDKEKYKQLIEQMLLK